MTQSEGVFVRAYKPQAPGRFAGHESAASRDGAIAVRVFEYPRLVINPERVLLGEGRPGLTVVR